VNDPLPSNKKVVPKPLGNGSINEQIDETSAIEGDCLFVEDLQQSGVSRRLMRSQPHSLSVHDVPGFTPSSVVEKHKNTSEDNAAARPIA
jgi:hypothetical protein